MIDELESAGVLALAPLDWEQQETFQCHIVIGIVGLKLRSVTRVQSGDLSGLAQACSGNMVHEDEFAAARRAYYAAEGMCLRAARAWCACMLCFGCVQHMLSMILTWSSWWIFVVVGTSLPRTSLMADTRRFVSDPHTSDVTPEQRAHRGRHSSYQQTRLFRLRRYNGERCDHT